MIRPWGLKFAVLRTRVEGGPGAPRRYCGDGDARHLLTERARRPACRRDGQDGDTVARGAASYGVGWQAIMNTVREYGVPLVDDRTGSTESVASA